MKPISRPSATVRVLFGGWWSDHMLRQGKSANVARKLPIILGLLLASTIVTANFVDEGRVVIAILSLAFFAQGMAALGWTLVSDIAGRDARDHRRRLQSRREPGGDRHAARDRRDHGRHR
jgi:MFS family permease